MKNFLKMTLATLTGLLVFGVVAMFIMVAAIGALASMGEKQPVMPAKAVLTINMSTMMLSEQTKEGDPFASLQSGGGEMMSMVGIRNAINAVNAAATDPAVSFIYMKPDGMLSGVAHLEEFRKALENFRSSGKAIVSYMENPTNGSYYLASVSDKIYMTPYDGGINMFTGLSSQMIFLKDLLDRLGVNIQLIRHGKYKSAGEMFIRSTSSKENMEQNKAMVDSMWESWASQIADSREMTVDELNSLLNDLKLELPADWLENGLVDELLTREQLHAKLCDLYVTDSYKDIKSISIQDYAKLKNTTNLKARNKVAVIYAEGNIVDGKDNQQVAGDRFAEIISKVRQDSTVKAVVLRVNSPGGAVLAAEKIKAEVDLLQKRVPVIASFGDYAASGGYWISAGCNKIYSDATSLTGSIGVFSIVPDLSGTLDRKLHVNITPVNSNRHADMYNGLRPLTPAETSYMQATVESVYSRFTSVVAEGRGMTVQQVEELAQGRVWTGAEAVRNGLVDEIGNIEDAIRYAAMSIEGVESAEDVQIVEFPKPQTTLEILLESFEGSTPSVFAGTPFEDVERTFHGWNASESGKVYARMPYEIVVR
ncbi:MAG: signal peptide peptidase SppA [Bacteroidales bacterium]|nr:signal peptide peptidase SppA [Bacteroidales bacterium]